MKNSNCHVMVLLTVCQLSLTACGGGGGGMASGTATTPTPASPTVSQPVVTQTTPAPTVVTPANFQPATTAATYPVTAAVSGAGSTGLSPASPGEGLVNATVGTDPSGSFSRVSFTLPNVAGKLVIYTVNLTFVAPQLAELASMLKQAYGPFQDDVDRLALIQSAGAQGLSYSAFGLWAESYEGDPSGNGAGRAFSFAFGNLTPTASMPATGSATFNGTTTGLGGGGANSLYALQGNAQITANFSAQSVTSKFTNLTTQNIYTNALGSLPDLAGTSTITGNAYSGPISGGALTGSINGNFYGPAAQETAGVWQASGSGNSWMGSYGAK